MRNWYNTERKSDWYKPLNYDPDARWKTYYGRGTYPTGDAEKTRTADHATNRKDRNRTSGRRIALIVLVVILTVAVFYSRYGLPELLLDVAGNVFHFSSGSDQGKDSAFGSYSYDPSGELPADYPEDFNEYFEAYYTAVESEETDVRIEKNKEPVEFTVQLHPSEGDPLSLKEIYASCAPSIVSIKGYITDEAGYNWGTGVVLSSDGLILTNTHVIDGCDSAEVVLTTGETFPAKLVGADAISDLAVLKIKAEHLSPAEFGESSVLSVGDAVAAIGNPLGDEFSGTLTNGIISAIERNISYNGRNMTLLQTNTALNEGNSGGALFNMFGQVIGITNMKMMSSYSSIEGIGFAIPSATVQTVVNSLIQYGEVRGRPSIGITVGAIPTNVSVHYDMPEGLYIYGVSAGSDAEKQGIEPGDILTAVDDQPVTSTDEVLAIKDRKNVGDTLKFSIWRNGEELTFTITLVDTNDIYK